jgi:predicted enzyme related to lactoylglutathione lyase
MLRGFALLNVYADDVREAADWYSQVFGIGPYYEVPGGYIEFRVGDSLDEFGIIDRSYAPPGSADGPSGAVMHWHVDDVEATRARLLELGATEFQPLVDRGGFIAGSMIDPFGNILGYMYNPHYLEMLEARG